MLPNHLWIFFLYFFLLNVEQAKPQPKIKEFDQAVITSLVATYFFETSNICPVRVLNREIWQIQMNMEKDSVNTLKFVICFHFRVTLF